MLCELKNYCLALQPFVTGISGASDENYILHLVKEAVESGFRAAVFNYRGLGGLNLKTPRFIAVGEELVAGLLT